MTHGDPCIILESFINYGGSCLVRFIWKLDVVSFKFNPGTFVKGGRSTGRNLLSLRDRVDRTRPVGDRSSYLEFWKGPGKVGILG